MRVTINLAKGSGSRELMQVLQAVEARATRRSHLDPLTMLNVGIHKITALALKTLEVILSKVVDYCGSSELRATVNKLWKRLLQTLFAGLRITIGLRIVKSS
jgi:hypothetical protein